jgi:tRNA(Ile)-lysidine synthase
MLNTVRKTVARHHLLERGERVLAAVSGGPDSVVLLRVLEILRDEYELKIDVAHLNHGLRGKEADNEEEFVRLICRKMGVNLFTKKLDIRELQRNTGKSVEEVAREARYRFLYQTADEHGAVKIATGHHRNDQAETLLINLLRGSGLEGLKGIAPILDGRLIRPLLYISRNEIIGFLKNQGLSYMTDSSNSDPTFLRNRIRKQLIPELEKFYNPQITAGLARTAEIIRVENDYMEGVVGKALHFWQADERDGRVVIPLKEFSREHEAIQARIVKSLLEEMAPFPGGISYRHIESVLEMCRKSDARTRRLNLPFGILVEKSHFTLAIRKKGDISIHPPDLDNNGLVEIKVEIPGMAHLNERKVKVELIEKPDLSEIKNHPDAAFMDYGQIEEPLFLRNIRPGDKIELLGSGGTKKLKKYFIDRKIPQCLRKAIPLLADSRSVVCIAGERISQRVRVTETTQKVLKVKFF